MDSVQDSQSSSTLKMFFGPPRNGISLIVVKFASSIVSSVGGLVQHEEVFRVDEPATVLHLLASDLCGPGSFQQRREAIVGHILLEMRTTFPPLGCISLIEHWHAMSCQVAQAFSTSA